MSEINWFYVAQLTVHYFARPVLISTRSKAAMSNPNGLLSQKLCHCLNQGRTLKDILLRAAHWRLTLIVSNKV